MPPIVAAAAIAAGGQIAGGVLSSRGTSKAAELQSRAAADAAAAAERSTAEALAFTKSQAQNTYQNTEVNRRGNYDQWAAGQRRLGTLGQMMGLGDREIPGYVSGVDPQYTGASGGAGASSFGADQFNALFPSASLSPDQLVAAEGELAKRGVKVLRNAAGTAGKIQLPNGEIVDVIQGAGTGLNRRQWLTGGGSSAPARQAGTVGSYLYRPTPTRARTLTPALEMPDPYAPIARYLGV